MFGRSKQPRDIQFVDELAGPQDYWMTLREVARHKFATLGVVRLWVTDGYLPVKRGSVHVDSY